MQLNFFMPSTSHATNYAQTAFNGRSGFKVEMNLSIPQFQHDINAEALPDWLQ
jgi:hypothetical protein